MSPCSQETRPGASTASAAAVAPARVYDLGCGPGEVTRLMAERWPAAKITGLDNDKNMLDLQ